MNKGKHVGPFNPSSLILLLRAFAPLTDNDESGGVGQDISQSPDGLWRYDCQRERSGRMAELPGFLRHANLAKVIDRRRLGGV